MKAKYLYSILIILLPVMLLAQESEIINIARKVYLQPQFQNVYRDYLPPKVIELKTLVLPSEQRQAIKNDPKNPWREAENNQAFYIVEFPISLDQDTIFQENYGAQVYVWKDSKKPFIIKLGTNAMGYPVDWNATVSANVPNPYDNKEYTITYSPEVPLKEPIIRKAKYGDIITITIHNKVVENPNDGWTVEDYYVLNAVKNGQLVSKILTYSSEGNANTYSNIYDLKFVVRGNLDINMSKIVEEYEGWVN